MGSIGGSMNPFPSASLGLLLLLPLTEGNYWCNEPGVTCSPSSLLRREPGVVSLEACRSLWEECWLFFTCQEVPCTQCKSGIWKEDDEDCSTLSSITSPISSPTTSPTTSSGSPSPCPDCECPPLPQEGGTWTCLPEVPPGSPVPEGAHCIWECANSTSLHT